MRQPRDGPCSGRKSDQPPPTDLLDESGACRSSPKEWVRYRPVAVGRSGLIAVLKVGGGRVLTVEPETGRSTLVAEGLVVGYLTEPYPRSGSIAVGSDDAIYVAAAARGRR